MENRVIVILGTTASGKSGLAHRLAREIGGEIVSMDSMTIYRGMDIGTAKPSAEQQEEIPYHLIDIVEPWESFSVKRYVELADAAIADIHARGRPAFVVGGTMLYFKAFYHGIFEGPSSDPAIRAAIKARAAAEGVAALYEELKTVDPVSAERIHPNDLRRIERALEVYQLSGQPISAFQQEWATEAPRRNDWNWILLGVRRDREANSRRINERVRQMMKHGLIEEARRLFDDSRGVGDQAGQAVGYAELFSHFRGECPLDYAAEQIKIHTRRLAKHQRTWMRRLPDVEWIDIAPKEAKPVVVFRMLDVIKGRSGDGSSGGGAAG